MGRFAILLLASCLLQCGSQNPRELRIATRSTISSLDPYSENSAIAFSVYSNIYEPLVTRDRNLRITPALAMEWRNPDDLTWVLLLRPNVVFHDGTPLTAQDVRASLERARDESRSKISNALWMMDQVEVLNLQEVRIKTKKPFSSFLNRLAEVLILPAKSQLTDPEALSVAPGTGPYRVRSWQPGKSVVLDSFPSYWAGSPAIERVCFLAVPELDRRISGLKSDEYHILPQLEPSVIHDASVAKNKKIEITTLQGLGIIYLGMDLQRERSPYVDAPRNPFLDPRVRKAIHHAVNTKHIVRDILEGFAEEATQMVAPMIFGFNKNISRPQYDPEKARTYLKEAGYEQGFKVRFDFSNDRYRNDAEIGKAVALDLEKIGLQVRQNALPRQMLFKTLNSCDSSLYMVGWFLSSGDASGLFDYVLHTRDEPNGYGRENAGGYSNRELDLLIETSAGIMKPTDRSAILQRMMKIAMDDLPYIPLHMENNFCASSAALEWQPRADEYIYAREIRWKPE